MDKVVLFIDANIFLHYRLFTDVDWRGQAKADEVTIVFPPITLRELNDKKELSGSQKLRKRAQTALMTIGRTLGSGPAAVIGYGVDVHALDADPTLDFKAHKLNDRVQDDWLLASVIEHRLALGAGARVAIVTADIGLMQKCRSHKIEVIELPDDLLLPEDLDQEAKTIRKLENELLALKNALPSLSIVFADQSTTFTTTCRSPVTLEPASIAQALEELSGKYPKLAYPTESSGDDDRATASIANEFANLTKYSREEISKYNNSIDQYLEYYQQGLKNQHDFENIRRRSIRLEVLLKNRGASPASDVIINMHFPDGFRMCTENEFPNEPVLPTPPKKPKSRMEQLQEMRSLSQFVPHDYLRRSVAGAPVAMARNVSAPSIKRTNSYDVEFSVKKISHGFSESLAVLMLVLEMPVQPQTFQISYTIHAANLPVPATGNLVVSVGVE